MTLEFTTAKKSREPIEFVHDGRKIKFDPPKSAVMMMPMMDRERGTGDTSNISAIADWLDAGLNEKDQKYFEDRLRDPKDDFDIDDLDDLTGKLMEEISGRPTS